LSYSGVGKETRLLLAKQDEQIARLDEILRSLSSPELPKNIRQGEVFKVVETIDKASTFTDTEVNIEGFNLVQLSTDGDLTDVSYKTVMPSGATTPSEESSHDPHIVGAAKRLLVTNDTAESGKTIWVIKTQAPWFMLPAIQHGTSEASGGSATEARFTPLAKGRIFYTTVNTTADFFASDLTVTYTPTLFRIQVNLSEAVCISARVTNSSTTVTSTFNSSTALTAGALYLFDRTCRSGDTINFRHGGVTKNNCVVNEMYVDEIPAGTQ
jgi:hypothetical protein